MRYQQAAAVAYRKDGFMDKVKARRESIVKLLETAPIIPVTEMADLLGVTKETIRKDLTVLEKQGLVVWRHGGAALTERSTAPIPYTLRESFHKKGKRQIAKAACALIQEADFLMLESSTTTMALCQELLERPELLKTLTIVTNSLYIAQLFEMGALVKKLFFLGGWLTSSEGATEGRYTCDSLLRFHPDKVFISGAALDEKMRLTAYYENDMYLQRQAIQCGKRVILLLDKTKYPSAGFFAVSDLTSIHCLVTDVEFPERERKWLSLIHI